MAGTSQPTPGPIPSLDTLPTNTPDQFSFKSATFEEVLEELSRCVYSVDILHTV